MKKLYIMILALILAMAMIVPMTIPVAADPPEDTQKPLAWVNGADCTNNNYAPFGLLSSAISVKYLSDGTTVGKVVTQAIDKFSNLHIFVHSNTFDQEETYWGMDGDSKYFRFVYIEPDGDEFRVTLYDNGEGKKSDPDQNLWEESDGAGGWQTMFPLQPIPNGNNQIHLPDDPNDYHPIP
jgi:hypothetical protein